MNTQQLETALFDLERIGQWQAAFDAETHWNHHEPWFVPDDLDLPWDTRKMVAEINQELII